MCTAINFNGYFGRTLDLYYNYNEKVTITPRNFEFEFKMLEDISNHFAFIGMATSKNGYPLYYEATNEKGLSIAGLNFPNNAYYNTPKGGKINITPFELIPFILSRFASVDEAVKQLQEVNLININFSNEFPLTPLHWLISDKVRSVVLEPLQDETKIYENPVEVLTNNPTFDVQLFLLQNYMGLSNENPKKSFSSALEVKSYSLGMGAIGLPGDYSSPSRFARAVFSKENSTLDGDEASKVGQFFHVLDTVAIPKGSVKTDNGEYQYTRYTSCCNINKGIYYYTTYENCSITAVNMFKQNLNSKNLITFDLKKQNVSFLNFF